MSECPYCNNSFDMNETCHDEFRMWQGLVGPYYSPAIENGVLTWTNTGGLPNPDPISVVGPPGNGLYIGGMVETVSDLPETAEDGVTWLVGTDDPYEGYVFLDGSWVSIGQLALGPAGPAGPIGPTGPVGPAGSIGPPGLEVSDTAPTSDVLAWIDTDEDTEILVPEMHTTSTPNVLDMGSEYLDAAAVYDTTQGKTQAEINAQQIVNGSNSNGSYTKFSDGTLIQWGWSPDGYGAGSRLVTVTLPVAFVNDGYAVSATNAPLGDAENYRGMINTVISVTASSFTVRQQSVGTYTEVHHFYWIAIGRWK